MAKEELKLSNQVCFPLYAATREMTKRYRPLLKELDITYPQYLVMLVLWEHEQLTVKALGEELYLDSGTLTPMLKRMEADGLLTRTRSSKDERVVLVELTEAGKKLEEKAASVPARFFEETNLEPNELIQLQKLLNKVLNNSRE